MKQALTAGDRRMAAGMPSTSRFGMTLVNSEPGPSVMTSAAAMARSVAASGRALRLGLVEERLRALVRVHVVQRRIA